MPRKLERKLREEAKSKFPEDKDAQRRYVYGTMNKLGFLKGKKKEEKKNDPDEHDYRD